MVEVLNPLQSMEVEAQRTEKTIENFRNTVQEGNSKTKCTNTQESSTNVGNESVGSKKFQQKQEISLDRQRVSSDLENKVFENTTTPLVQKPKMPPKREKKGRTTNQLQFLLKTVMRQVLKHSFAWPFTKPVDAVKLRIPDYYEIIKRPMDLGTVKKKLEHNDYICAKDCIEEFRLVFQNCYSYNKPGEDVVVMAETVEKFFDEKIATMPPEEYEIIKGGKSGPKPSISKTGGDLIEPATKKAKSIDKPMAKPMDKPQTIAADSTQPALTSPNLTKVAEVDTITTSPTSTVTSTVPMTPDLLTPKLPSRPTTLIKSGVKRKKADTTTPTPVTIASGLSTPILAAKIPLRRESSNRTIKKPTRELPGEQEVVPPSGKKKGKLTEQMKYCNNILKELFAKKHETCAWPFYKPVAVDELGLHDYLDIIKQPMDLTSIRQKMETRKYNTPHEFATDVRLIFSNCYKYNPPDHDVVKMARKLQDVFEYKFARMPDEPPEQEMDSIVATPSSTTANATTKVTRSSNKAAVATTVEAKSESEEDSDEESSDSANDSDTERKRTLAMLEAQLISVHEELSKLTKVERDRKAEKVKKGSKKKDKDKGKDKGKDKKDKKEKVIKTEVKDKTNKINKKKDKDKKKKCSC